MCNKQYIKTCCDNIYLLYLCMLGDKLWFALPVFLYICLVHVLSLLFLAWYGEAVELAVQTFLKHPLVIS